MTIISQTETALTKKSQAKKQELQKAKGQKTEARDIEQTITAGTVCDPELISEGDANARYLLTINESMSFVFLVLIILVNDGSSETSEFAICFVDTTTVEIGLSHFVDDKRRTLFETLLLRLKPREVLYEKVITFTILLTLQGSLTKTTMRVIQQVLPSACVTHRGLPNYQTVLSTIENTSYFEVTNPNSFYWRLKSDNEENRLARWPKDLAKSIEVQPVFCAFGLTYLYLDEVRLPFE